MDVSEGHCSNCGRGADPFAPGSDGYSECCDRICSGPGFGNDRFALKKAGDSGGRMGPQVEIVGHVEACCVAAAQAQADRQGLEVAWKEI